ncbi:MAG: flagellar basal body rod protein FlgB [Bacillota bacterium]
MLDGIFGNMNYLQKGLDAASLRNEVISNNIANVDTPGFKRSDVEFESYFKAALEDGGFTAKTTRDKHIKFSSSIDGVSPLTVQDNSTSMRMDGNNVDIDAENALLAANTIYYDTLVEKLNSEITRLSIVINEGK